jgi:membrane protein implicated in regulation of membrane protease activity
VTILNKPMRRPVPLACSATLGAMLFLAAGVSGYTMNKHDAFVAGTRWTDGPIWWQVAVGLVLLAASVWLWRRAIRSLRH